MLGEDDYKTRTTIDGISMTGLATIQKRNDLKDISEINELTVSVKPFDDLWCHDNMGKLGFVKIDVEGYEYEVLKGMARTLVDERPMLLVEIENRHNPKKFEDTFNFLSGIGYLPFFTKEDNICIN